MRTLIKGGVWKNSEDEILKTAIMKYGKNEWARVATLLPRKTAKQCKRRWNEWLDPMIKKTEWTKEEDEKLLHLAKLMPTQWRTIAPMIGRTAGQCLERYGKLLDLASGVDEDESEEARRLRVGEMDMNPENRPARPDPVDMDEDEKEMLSEAKARLANINGKKAKRKAREKLLENAKRMAKLQKYRELKAAGVSSSISHVLRNKEKNGLDYDKEIPFERSVPMGFYDTSGEREEGLKRAHTMEGRKRVLKVANDDPNKRARAEQAAMRRDRERFEKLAKDNLEQAMKEIEERNLGAAATFHKRSKLVMPEPQVSDVELSEIARLDRKRRQISGAPVDVLNSTQVLLGEYPAETRSLARTALMRTPVAPDVVLEEARNQKLRMGAKTPLVGGETQTTTLGTGFTGHAPSVQSVITTPTPGHGASSSKKSEWKSTITSKSISSVGQIRDHFQLNQEDEEETEAIISLEEAKERKKHTISKLRAGLQSLPAPKYEYEIQVPSSKGKEDEGGQDDEDDMIMQDAADEKARERLAAKIKEKAILENRSLVVKRQLPIPSHENVKLESIFTPLVAKEACEIVMNDVQGKGFVNDSIEWKNRAEELIVEESKRNEIVDMKSFEKIWKEVRGSYVYVPTAVEVVSAGKKEKTIYKPPFHALKEKDLKTNEKLLTAKMEFDTIENNIKHTSKILKKLEKKANTLVYGLEQRAGTAMKSFIQTQQELQTVLRNNDAFRYMREKELASIPARQDEWETRASNMGRVEQEMQLKYYEALG